MVNSIINNKQQSNSNDKGIDNILYLPTLQTYINHWYINSSNNDNSNNTYIYDIVIVPGMYNTYINALKHCLNHKYINI